MLQLKVSSKSKPASVAGAIAVTLEKETVLEVQAIGAGAVNQTVKAIAIARGYLAPVGKDIVCVPSFNDIKIGTETKSAIKFTIKIN